MNRFVKAIALSMFILIGHSLSAAPLHSQKRDPGESWTKAYERYASAYKKKFKVFNISDSAYSAAKDVNLADFSNVTVMDKATMTRLFAEARDVRFLQDVDHPGSLRRSTWLYPDDGCYARAGLFNQNAEGWKYDRPSKIFAFGDLNVQTVNSPTGSVTWWYHVAPLVSDGHDIFVLDPALNPTEPTPLNTWLAMMVQNTADVKISVCNSYSYGPYSPCANSTANEEYTAVDDQLSFLTSEWDRLIELGRDPVKELGDEPPWLDSSNIIH